MIVMHNNSSYVQWKVGLTDIWPMWQKANRHKVKDKRSANIWPAGQKSNGQKAIKVSYCKQIAR